MSSTTTLRNRSLLLLLFFFFLQNFDSSAQENVQLTGFNCTFISTDGVSAFPCATKVTATITLPNNNLVTSVNLVFPNSFCVNGISAEGGGNPNFTNLGQTSIGNITVPDGQLMNLAISPTAQPIIVEFEYKNFNVYNANGQVNTNFLLFDCSGTGNNITYLSNLNGSNLQTIPDDWGFVQLNHNSNAPISLVHGSMGNESMNPGESYIRTFFVDIFSLSVDEFWLTITDEVDAILSNTVIYKDGQVNLPLIYDSGTPANVFNFQNYIVPGPNGARRLQFSQTVILVCNNNNPQITTVKAGLTCYCNSANSSVNFYTPITLNGTAGVMPNLSIEGQSFTSNVAENECTTFTLEIPFTVTGSALYASLENIHIPLSQIWAQNISSIAVIAGEYSTSINSNYTSDNGGLSIVFSTLSSTLQGFQPSINSTTGQWFNSSFKLQIVFNNPLTSSSSSCNGLPALQLYANNTLSLNLRSSCSTSIQNTYSLNPVTAHVTPVVLTTTNSDTDLAYYSENDQHANLVFDVYNLTTMPITMYSNSNPQPLCGNIDYSLVVEIAEFGVPLTLDFISELSINNVSVANATIENGNLIVPLSTLSAYNEPNLQKVKFKLQYSGVCPDGTEDNNFGSYIIKAQIRAECPDCDNATLILKCAEHELFVHCPGTCETAVHIDKNIQARRITLGFEGLSQFNQNFPLTELSGNLNEDEKKNELTKVYPFDLVEIITQGEVYHQNTNDNSLYSMTQVGFELSVSDVFGNGDNDFLNIHQVNAVFTNLQNQSLIFTLPENAYSFIGWQSEAVPGISQSMKIGRLFFTLPSEISLSEDSWKIDLILVLRVGALPELAPNYYPVSFRCQYIATKPGGGYHTSCDPYGFNLMVLKTAVISANSSVAIVAPDNPNNRSFVLPHILGNAIDNLPALSSCEADGVVGYRIIGGFNGAISDFEHEFRPVIGWPNSGYIEGLAEVKGIYSDQSEFVLQSEPGNFARTSNPAIQDARANILGTQGYQGFYYKINKPCAFGNSNSTVPLNVTLDINAHAYIHDGFQLSALPPALPAPNLTYVPNMNNLDWNPNFNSTYNIPNFENPIAQNGTFNFNLKMPAGLGNKPMFLFFSISDFVGNSPPTIGTPTIAGFELHSSITNLFISNEGISDVDYTSFSIPINVNCFPSAFNINVAWGISCDPDYNFFSIANIGEILPLPGITTTCPNNFATRSFRFKHINNPFAETNNLVADNETCELVWTLNFTNPINNSPAVFNEFNLNFFTGLLYTEAVVSYTEPGNSNPNQPTLNPPAFNVTLPGGSITTQPLVYTTLSLNPSEFTIAPGATISYVLRFKLSEDVCANFNDYLPNNFLSFFSWQTDCQPPTNGPITVINKPILLELVSQIINQATNPDCCVPVPITYELKPNCNASEWPFNGELTLNMADPCTSAYHYRLIRTINDTTVEEEQGHLGGSDPCSATISNLAHGTYGLIYFNSEAGWYFVQTITIGDIQLVASFDNINNSPCVGQNVSISPTITTNTNNSITYQWYFNSEPITNQTNNEINNISQSGLYGINISNGVCNSEAEIAINFIDIPVISISNDLPSEICVGQNGNLSVISDGEDYTYIWGTGESNQNLLIEENGDYSVTATNSFGCSSSAFININQFNPPDFCQCICGTQNPIIITNENISDILSQFGNNETIDGMCFRIQNSLVINVNCNISNCRFIMSKGSFITINPNINLYSLNTDFEGCQYMWKGINNSGRARFINCTFKDAQYALNLIRTPNKSGTVLRDCHFSNNYIGVNVEFTSNTSLTHVLNLSGGNVFDGGALKTEFYGQYPQPNPVNGLAAIRMQQNFFLSIHSTNTIQNLFTGIISDNSHIISNGTLFKNIQYDPLNLLYEGNAHFLNIIEEKSGAIYAYNNSTIRLNGLGTTDNSPIVFDGCKKAIVVENSSLIATNLRIDGTSNNPCEYGFVLANQNSHNFAAIRGNRIRASRFGIKQYGGTYQPLIINPLSNLYNLQFSLFQNAFVNNNIHVLESFNPNEQAVIPEIKRYGIAVSNYTYTSSSTSSLISIHNNTIRLKAISESDGVHINSASNIELVRNFINREKPSKGASVSFENSNNSLIACNNINAASEVMMDANNFGVLIKSSKVNVIANAIDLHKTLMQFDESCLGTNIANNKFIDNPLFADGGSSLRIGVNGVVGTQANGWNKFTGANPFAIKDLDQNGTGSIGNNLFTVQVDDFSNPFSEYYPPHDPEDVICLIDNFFRCFSGTASPPSDICDTDLAGSGIAAMGASVQTNAWAVAQAIANHTFDFSVYHDETIYSLKRSIDQLLLNNLLTLPDTGSIGVLKQQLLNSNIRNINVIEDCLSKYDSDSLLMIQMFVNNILLDTLMKQHAQIMLDYASHLYANDSTFYDHIYSTLSQLDSLSAIRVDMQNTLLTLLNSKYNIINSALQAISPTNAAELAYLATQAINIQNLNQISSGFSLSDKLTIEDIAYQCPLKLGKPVYLARAMMMAYNDTARFNNYELCNLVGMQYRKPAPIPPATKGLVKVYPNPTKGLLTIETDLSDSEVATIQLINQLGQPCASAYFKGNTFVWDLSSYPLAKGLYFIQIRTQSINHQTKIVYEN